MARGKKERKKYQEHGSKKYATPLSAVQQLAAEMDANEAFPDLNSAAFKIWAMAHGKKERKEHRECQLNKQAPAAATATQTHEPAALQDNTDTRCTTCTSQFARLDSLLARPLLFGPPHPTFSRMETFFWPAILRWAISTLEAS